VRPSSTPTPEEIGRHDYNNQDQGQGQGQGQLLKVEAAKTDVKGRSTKVTKT